MARTQHRSMPFQFAHAYEREILLISALGFCAFYFVAIASFSPMDESVVAVQFPQSQPLNLAGAIGAHISGLVIFLLGVGAFLVPLPVLNSAVAFFKRSPYAFSKSRMVGWFLAIVCATTLADVFFPVLPWRDYQMSSGGVVGTQVAQFLVTWLGEAGSIITIVTLSVCALVLIAKKSFFEWVAEMAVGSWSSWSWPKLSLPAIRVPQVNLPKISMPRMQREPAVEDGDVFEPEVMVQAEPEFDEGPDLASQSSFPKIPRLIPSLPKAKHPVEKKRKSIFGRPGQYKPPSIDLFDRAGASDMGMSKKELEQTAAILVKTFEDFGIQGRVIGYQPGPVVTVFEFQPNAGIKQSKVMGLIDDLALALRVDSIFINPVSGKRALGIQVPNASREKVFLGDILDTSTFADSESPLTFGMGKSLNGEPICSDLATMPHLLCAGATGAGKSVAINSLLSSILMKAQPEDVRMILVDPKMLELSVYEGVPHLLMPVITEPSRASLALQWAINEMERRYKLMQHARVRNLSGFNQFWDKAPETKKEELRQKMGDETIERLPFLLIVIDELADLMLTAPKDVESAIQRLAQKARASGIHMVLATQRPSVDIITGVIKANLPCRISFQVVSKHDSRTILDVNGAEKLLGKGDMLFQRPGVGRLERIQGALITDEEVLNLVEEIKQKDKVSYDEGIMAWIDEEVAKQSDGASGEASCDDDPKWDEAITVAQTHGVVSASFLQRHLKIGYNRAARIVEAMQAQGLVAPASGSKPRKWLGPGGHVA